MKAAATENRCFHFTYIPQVLPYSPAWSHHVMHAMPLLTTHSMGKQTHMHHPWAHQGIHISLSHPLSLQRYIQSRQSMDHFTHSPLGSASCFLLECWVWDGTLSTWGASSQNLLHLLAAMSIFLQDLSDMLFLFTLQNTQEVLQLRHTEGIPLQKERETMNL